MIKFITLNIFLFLFFSLSQTMRAQGCSDAGFCTIQSMKPASRDTAEEKKLNRIRIGISNGKADYGIGILSSYLEYNRSLTDNIGVDVKVNFLSQSGAIGSSSGISDLFINANHQWSDRFFATIGIKVPLSDGNKKENGLSLPMDLQPSLGTFDVIAGLGTSIGTYKIAIALQQPLSQNKNQFLAAQYPPGSEFRFLQSTNGYKRSGDLLLRISYPIMVDQQWSITPSILPIYHIANDKYTDGSGSEQTIKGSQGLTLNVNIFSQYMIDSSHQIEASIGSPVVTRSARPDGLTRSYVLTIELKKQF